jgi:hypothetical protein
MKEKPTDPAECKICGRVEDKIKSLPIIQEKLSNDEKAYLVHEVQSAVLNKSEGKNMAENDTYIMEKAQFNEFYNTLDTLIKATGANVDRTRGIEDVVMKMVHGFADVVAKVDELAERVDDLSMPGMEEEEVSEYEEEPMEDEESSSSSSSSSSSDGEEEEFEEEVEMPEGGEIDTKMLEIPENVEKAIFEAGWKAHEAEVLKSNGVPVNQGNYEYPQFNQNRPGATASEMNKSLDSKPAGIPNDFNAWANTKPGDILKGLKVN